MKGEYRSCVALNSMVILRVVDLTAFVNCFRSLQKGIDGVRVSLLISQGML